MLPVTLHSYLILTVRRTHHQEEIGEYLAKTTPFIHDATYDCTVNVVNIAFVHFQPSCDNILKLLGPFIFVLNRLTYDLSAKAVVFIFRLSLLPV